MKTATLVCALLGLAISSLWTASASAQVDIQAYAEVRNAQGMNVGQALLRESKEGVLVIVRLEKLPAGLHAMMTDR